MMGVNEQHGTSDPLFLLERARNGEMEAMGELVRSHRVLMMKWTLRLVGNHHIVEDIVQEALLLVICHLHTLQSLEKFIPWLRTIVRNQAFATLRRLQKETVHERQVEDIESALSWNDTRQRVKLGYVGRWGNDPLEILLWQSELEEARGLLAYLGEREREILHAYVFEELSVANISEKLGVTSSAVYTALFRARRKLNDARQTNDGDNFRSSPSVTRE